MLSLILLITGSIAAYISIHKQMESRQSLLKTKESISLIKDILNTLLNAETGKRGYQLTGKEEFLEPLDKSGKEYPLLIADRDRFNLKDKLQNRYGERTFLNYSKNILVFSSYEKKVCLAYK